MIRVLIADDHPIVREGLKRILADYGDIQVSGEAEDGDTALGLCTTDSFDVVLLDISMPGPPFLETIRRLRSRGESPRVLVLSMHPEEQYALRALRAGASGYLSKQFSPAELASAIRRVAQGGRYVSEALGQMLAYAPESESEKAPQELLSEREYQVLCLIGSGKGIGQIGSELALSPKTISTYRTRILEKLGLAGNAEIIRFAIKSRLVD